MCSARTIEAGCGRPAVSCSAAGTLALLIRRTSFGEPWGDFLVFLILFALTGSSVLDRILGAARRRTNAAVAGRVHRPCGPAHPAHPVRLRRVGRRRRRGVAELRLDLPRHRGRRLPRPGRRRVRVGALLGALALSSPGSRSGPSCSTTRLEDLGTIRWLFLAAAAILLLLAAPDRHRLGDRGRGRRRGHRRRGRRGRWPAGSPCSSSGAPRRLVRRRSGKLRRAPSLFWDLELLLASLALLGFGRRRLDPRTGIPRRDRSRGVHLLRRLRPRRFEPRRDGAGLAADPALARRRAVSRRRAAGFAAQVRLAPAGPICPVALKRQRLRSRTRGLGVVLIS